MTRLVRVLLRSATLAAVGVSCHPAPGPNAVAPVALAPPYDVEIEGGRIVDGSGNAWFYGDLAITGDRIARIAPPGTLRGARTRQRVDGHGLVVAPGFIDIQAHSRDALLTGDGRVVGKATQGVATEIMGEGWTNAPGNFATTEELVAMAKAMAPYGGVYITHMRSEADQFLEAIDEAIRIGREGGVPVEIYHLKAAGRRNWPKAAAAIAKIDSARSAGLHAPGDKYPAGAGGGGPAA